MEQSAIDSFVVTMTEALTTTKDFVILELPDVCQQLLTYHFVKNVLCIVALIALFSIGLAVFFPAYKKAVFHGMKRRLIDKRDREEWEKHSSLEDRFINISIASGFSSAALGVGVFVSLFQCGDNILNIWLAPKVYLIEYFKSLVV